jgi:glutamyl-tRNA reductase
VDITVPRTVDAAVAALPDVSLIDFAALETTAPRGAAPGPDAESHASPFVEDGVRRFMAWWRSQAVIPTIARLHARADAVRDAEVERALARLPHLSERERRIVVGLARRIVSKLLHEPTAALKDDPEGANMAVVMRALFALDDDAPALASCPIAHDVPGIIAPTDLASPRASEASLAPLAPIEEPTFL